MLNDIVSAQKRFFATGRTRPLDFRIASLKKLKRAIEKNETAIMQAVATDLGRPATETYTSEVYPVLKEIELISKNLKKWARSEGVPTPVFLWPGKSRIHYEPLGAVLILGPWNYPFQLMLSPLAGAIAAGNCAIIKPSEVSEHSAEVISDIVEEAFDKEHVRAVEGGPEVARELLKRKFDHIFFTGGAAIGKKVMAAAAENLTPVTLELGGKCPCIVLDDADIGAAARRIAWGKFFNAGQTCLAPDYAVVHSAARTALVAEIRKCIAQFYGEKPAESPDYGRIVNRKHFDRILGLVENAKPPGFSANPEQLCIPPTVLEDVPPDAPLMEEEIFGPVLPVLEFRQLDEAIELINGKPKPLAVYVFARDQDAIDAVVGQTSSGSVTINDVLIQAASNRLPFGGVGQSGMGRYRGRSSFLTFSNAKSVMKRGLFPDWKFRYPPYKVKIEKLKKVLKFF